MFRLGTMQTLTQTLLQKEAALFAAWITAQKIGALYGVNDGKAVGTYLEHQFKRYLQEKNYLFDTGNSASGIDFPSLEVDLKVTSVRQPQSSCPFKSARQKIYGLGYSLLVFVYDKVDFESEKSAQLSIANTLFVAHELTADFQTTKGLLGLLSNEANNDDISAFLLERNLPLDEIGLNTLIEEIMRRPPKQGYLTISNALQWRLQYARVIEKAGAIDGLLSLYKSNLAL